jgi:hypothetical protein
MPGAALAAALVVCLMGPRLLAQGPAGAVKIWTSDVVLNDLAPPATRELKPIKLIGARNGTFSGKIMIESGGTIKGVQASVGALTGTGGTIAASNLQVRYAIPSDVTGWMMPRGPDTLLEAPAEVAPGRGGAVLPVWVTVKVPKDAKTGTYSGEVAVQAQGAAPVKVPLTLEVVEWTLPDPQDYRTWMDIVESPDTLALEYKVPLWSDKHWQLIDRSFRLMSSSGSRVVYVPLICRTNFGNEQSMVRWIPKADGKYEYDYTVLDKYLDSAQKNLGKPKLVIFLVWDICMSKDSLNRGLWGKERGGGATIDARQELLGKGPRVTAIDPVTKEANSIFLPRYEDAAASKILWRPMWAEIQKKMAARGLEKTMMLGIMPDLWPNKEEVAFWNDVSGGLAWAIHGHAGHPSDAIPGNKGLYKIADIGYAAFVYNLVFNVNPEKGRMYGWQNPALLSNYFRNGAQNMANATEMREFPVFNITGGQRGGGRMGGDFWKVVRGAKGARSGAVWARYPENNWRNLDLIDWFLAPGPDGAVATTRLECLKEGIQECEARIVMEDALLNASKKARLGEDLAGRCQAALDEHHWAMWKTVCPDEEALKKIGKISEGRFPAEGLAKAGRTVTPAEAAQGQAWFAQGWQDREKKLFVLAGEVAAKLGGK